MVVRANMKSDGGDEGSSAVSARELKLAAQVAHLKVERGLKTQQIADQFSRSVAWVDRLMHIARENGILIQGVVAPVESDTLAEIRDAMMSRMPLKEVVLVRGREEMLEGSLPGNTREAILLSAERAAATYLQEHLVGNQVVCLAWGRIVQAVIQCLHSLEARPRVSVVPLLGVLSQRPDEFEANTVVQQMAAALGTPNYYCLPCPAIVRDPQDRQVTLRLPVVKDVLERIRQANFVVTSVAAPDPQSSTLVRKNLLEASEIETLRASTGAVGEICAWWFDRNGQPVGDPRIQPIGLGLDGMKKIAADRRGTVMVIVGADLERVEPLLAAIRGKLINMVVTDHVTGQELLKRWER